MNINRFSRANRLIHWAIALVISFIMLTVFLRMGWMHKEHFGLILQTSLAKLNIIITPEQATNIGKDLRRPMWNYHIWAGYVMIGLYVLRMIITYVQGINYKNPLDKKTTTKEKFKSWIYIVFYILLAITLITGFFIVNGPKDWKETLEFIHVQSLYYVVIFIIVHIAGVLIADKNDEPGLISKMISGDK